VALKIPFMNFKTKLPENKAFYVQNGPVVTSLKGLADALEKDEISDDAFQFHLTNNNNDFLNWIDGVYGEQELIKALKRVKTKKGFVKKLQEVV
jgi:hypothetical protein